MERIKVGYSGLLSQANGTYTLIFEDKLTVRVGLMLSEGTKTKGAKRVINAVDCGHDTEYYYQNKPAFDKYGEYNCMELLFFLAVDDAVKIINLGAAKKKIKEKAQNANT